MRIAARTLRISLKFRRRAAEKLVTTSYPKARHEQGRRNPGLFQRLLTRPAPQEYDAADMGTCFGLEMSLDQPDVAVLPPQATPGRARGWVQRLAGRGKGAPAAQ